MGASGSQFIRQENYRSGGEAEWVLVAGEGLFVVEKFDLLEMKSLRFVA